MIPIAKPVMEEEEKKAVMDVLSSGMLAQGKKVAELESSFAKYCGVKYAVALNSGTAALHTALYALGIGKGDFVLTTPFTFIATVNSILMQNANVAFSDIRSDTFNIDSERLKVPSGTRAIIPVDIFGQPADYDALETKAKEGGLKVIEDAAQAVGAKYKGKRTGSFGDISCFSLYATKNLTAGEGGMITTDSEEYCMRARSFRSHGQSQKSKYHYNDIGYNYRMTEISAAIALEQLKKVDSFNEKRRKNAKVLSESLSQIAEISIPFEKPDCRHVFHQYSILVPEKKRDHLISVLKKNDIGYAVFYPEPLHLSDHLLEFGYNVGDFPKAEAVCRQVISLPVHPHVSEEDLESIIAAVMEAFH